MTLDELIGSKVREAREAEGMTQEALGEALVPFLGRGWSKRTIWLLESGLHQLFAAELIAFASVLQRPLLWFYMPEDASARIRFPGGDELTADELDAAIGAGEDVRTAARLDSLHSIAEQIQSNIARTRDSVRQLARARRQ